MSSNEIGAEMIRARMENIVKKCLSETADNKPITLEGAKRILNLTKEMIEEMGLVFKGPLTDEEIRHQLVLGNLCVSYSFPEVK